MSVGHSRARVALALGALSLLAAGSDYRGCAATEPIDVPPDGATLPAAGGCVVDGDCAALDMCRAYGCRAGGCVELGPRVDADGDGFSPPPCGDDCDDRAASYFPGAREQCDGVDQDCDGLVDEGAAGARASQVSDGLLDAALIAVGERFVVLGRDAEGAEGLFGYLVATDGTMGTRARVSDQPVGPHAAVGREDGTIFFVHAPFADAPPLWMELAVEGSTILVASAETPIGSEGGVSALAVLRHGGQDWVAFDTADGDATRRWLARSGDPTPVDLGPEASGDALALATDGTSVVVTEGARTLRFVGTDGTLVDRRELPGPFASQPLASGDGLVYAAYRDAFDHALLRVQAGATPSPVAAPRGARDDSVGVFRVGSSVLVLRVRERQLRGWLLDAELATYEASFESAQLSPVTGPPLGMGVAVTQSGLGAVHWRYDGVSAIALLVCEAP